MSLTLLQNNTAMTVNLTTPFQGVGGVEPYAYSVTPGGVGGSIDSTTGIYTSPNALGDDQIVVTDSMLATAMATIRVLSPLELFCDVIQQGMGLADGRIWMYDQKVNEPKDSSLYIVVQVLVPKVFGSSTKLDNAGNTVQGVNVGATLSVDIKSRSTEALLRKEEVIMALSSSYAESQMELNSFYIAPITSAFVNISQLDGAAAPYRFNLSVNIQYFVKKTTAVAYYDTYQAVAVTTEP